MMSFENHVYEIFSGIIEKDGENFFKKVSDGYSREIATILENEDISKRSVQKKLIEKQNIRMEYMALYNKEKQKKFTISYVDRYRKKLAEAKNMYEIHMLKTILEEQKIYAEDESFFLPEKEKIQLLEEVRTKLYLAYKDVISKTNTMYEIRLLKEKLEERRIDAEENILSFFTEEEQIILLSEMDTKLEKLDQKKTSGSTRKIILAQNSKLLPAILNPEENNVFITKEKEALAS